MNNPTLVVLAAGMGSRYGGLKQIDAVGPGGEAIIDYSIYDAIRAGFGKLVFVIRRDIEAAFREAIGRKFDGRIALDYAYQELDLLPPGFQVPPNRQKPWGTAHAVLASQPVVHEPFAVINADDFYGRDSYQSLAAFLQDARDKGPPEYAMVGFQLCHTLSDHGSVSRGLCRANPQGYLESIVELTKVEKAGRGAQYLGDDGQPQGLTGDEPVSMNMFGFTPAVFGQLRAEFSRFLTDQGGNPKAEFFIPTPISRLIQAGQARMKVLPTRSDWFGITYREDKPTVIAKLRQLIDQGVYPEKLVVTNPPDILAIGRQFQITGELHRAVPFTHGHINDTYVATYLHDGCDVNYVHQRINHHVFKNPPAVMENIQRITGHIARQLEAAGEPDRDRRVLRLVPARDGQNYHCTADGNYWRTYRFIEKARIHDVVASPAEAYEAARAYGRFQRQLTDLPPPRLHETILNFHHTPLRYTALERALAADSANRAATARAEIEFARARESITRVLLDLQQRGEIPERVTHNDTKFNNVMLDDATHEAICVLDLDTVMPGLALYDFGDMVRTTTSPTAEDEQDLSQVRLEMDMFVALARGYLSEAGGFLTAAEKAHLAFAGKLITFEIGIRFLTDYLEGDHYFKTHRPGHNLDRSRTQFKLVESIETQEAEMNRRVARL